MGNLLWVVVAILIILWLLGFSVFHFVTTLVWIILVVAVVLAVIAFLTGGYMR